MVNSSKITLNLSPEHYKKHVAKPLGELVNKENIYINSQAWNIRDAHQQGRTFESRTKIDFPPIDSFAVTDLLFDPKKGLRIVARDQGKIIADEAAIPMIGMFPGTDLPFKKSWVTEDKPLEGQKKGLIRHIFREPEEVFKYLASKVFNTINSRIVDFAELAADAF